MWLKDCLSYFGSRTLLIERSSYLLTKNDCLKPLRPLKMTQTLLIIFGTIIIILGTIINIGVWITFIAYVLYKQSSINTWAQVSEDEVIWAWLKNEVTDPQHTFAESYKEGINKLEIDGISALVLDYPDFESTIQNNNRRQLFDYVRGRHILWRPIHKQTKWYRTKQLLNNPFRKIHAPYVPAKIGEPTSLDGIVLWGHSKSGPFVVLEGNHRWHARNKWKLNVATIYVGISNIKYSLHAAVGCDFCASAPPDM